MKILLINLELGRNLHSQFLLDPVKWNFYFGEDISHGWLKQS